MKARALGPLLAVSLILLMIHPILAFPVAVAQTQPVAPSPSFGGGIEGKVLSDAGGPLGGATVQAQGSGGSSAARTSPDGSYQVKLPPGTYTVTASARFHADRNATVVVGAFVASQDFTLRTTAFVIKGTVRDASSGAGVAGALVEASQGFDCRGEVCPMTAEGGAASPAIYYAPLQTTSGSDGRYAIAAGEGPVSLRAHLDGYAETWQRLEVKGNVTQDLSLSKQPPKSAVLAGRVTDAKTGAPLAGAWVSAWPDYPVRTASPDKPSSGAPGSTVVSDCMAPDGGFAACPSPCCQEGNSTQAGADGRFRMNMYPGDYVLSVGAQDHGQWQEKVHLGDGQILDVEVRLQPIPADSVTIKGTVTDQATGKPVANAYVSVENQEWGAYNGTATGSDGTFSLNTKPGWTLVWVRGDGGYGYASGVAMARPAEPSSSDAPNATPPSASVVRPVPAPQPGGPQYYPWVKGQTTTESQVLELRIALVPKPPADLRLQGYVLNATSNKPIEGANVNVHNQDTGDWGNAVTDMDGSYVLLVRGGVHTVQAWAEGYFTNAVVVRVAKETRVDLPLQPGRSSGSCCAYAMAEGRASAAMDASVPPGGAPAPMAAGGPAQGAPQGSAQAGGLGASGATYQSKGGLGPYTPPSPGQAPDQVGLKGAPGPGALLALAAVGLALALARRRRA